MAGNEKVFKDAMSQGHSAAWDQDWKKASEYYRKAVEEMPENSVAITSLGLAYFELEHYDEASACYARAAKSSPDDPLPIEKLAEIFERTGKVKEAAETSMKAADLHLKLRDADKALENWARVTRLIPEHLQAHSRLAVVHERLGRRKQAIREYISVAALLQDIGQIGEALNAVEKAVAIDPHNDEAKQAFEIVKSNKTLPIPKRTGGTGPLRMKAAQALENVPEISHEGPDPVGEARQAAMTSLAGLLFDVSSDDIDSDQGDRGLSGVFSGGDLDLSGISIHLGLAIDYQTRAQDEDAAESLKKAIDSGLNFPAAFFNLGLLYHRLDRKESAQRSLQRSVNHPDFALAARLLIAEFYREQGAMSEAAIEYLEALKLADIAVVIPELGDVLRSQYETLIEAQGQQTDEAAMDQLCENIVDLLMRPNWRKQVTEARAQLPSSVTGTLAMPLAEILTQAESTEMVQAIGRINQIARKGMFRTAMEEAYHLMSTNPTYLPLHIHMGELLIRQGHQEAAISKFTIVAQTYATRGEAKRSTELLQRIVEVAPLDITARKRLISNLSEMGKVDGAISEYINMADVHYRLAQLDTARTTYESALRLAQQANADPSWSVQIMHHMADIDMQRLDWRQALRVYEQLRTLVPDDEVTRRSLVELNVRLGQANQSSAELDNYLSFLSGKARDQEALAFLEGLVQENPTMGFAILRLAEFYTQAAQVEKAIEQWDTYAEIMIERKDMEGAKQAIRSILVLNPPNADQYRAALQKLG